MTDADVKATNVTASASRRAVGFGGLAVASFLGCIDLTIVTTALPDIGSALDAKTSTAQLTLGAFLMALSMFMVTAGRIADRYGRKRMLLIGLTVFVVASVGAALASSIAVLIVARFIQGSACAILYTSTSTLVESLFDEGERGRAIGWLYGVNGLGLAVGPVLGGLLVPVWGWESVFWINLPLGIAAGVAIAVAVNETEPNPDDHTDWPGQILVALTVLSAVGFFTLGDISGWASPAALAAAALFVLAVSATVVIERRVDDPLIDPRLFGNKLFAAAIASDFFLAVFYASALLILPLYLTDGADFGLRTAGLLLLLVSGTMALASPRVGKLVDREGSSRLLVAGFVGLTVAGIAFAVGSFGDVLGVVLVGLVLFGAGWAFILGPATAAALSSVPADRAGFAVGASWTFHNLGGAVGAAVAAVLYGNTGAADQVRDGLGRVALLILATSAVAVLVVRGLTAGGGPQPGADAGRVAADAAARKRRRRLNRSA